MACHENTGGKYGRENTRGSQKQSFKYNKMRPVLKKRSSTVWLLSLQKLQDKVDLLENLGQESLTASKSSTSGSTPPLKVGARPRSDTVETEKAIFHLLPRQSS